MLTGADIIAECLLEQGVDSVFGYPGGAVLNIYDALYKYSDRIHHTLTAHEQGASHAADGYARSTGKTGVVIATSGPGATNLVTGIATAFMDSVPMVAITGNVNVDLLGRSSFQEVNIKDIVAPVTKASYIVMRVEDIAPTIREAFRIAQSGRKGPVLVDIPKDLTSALCEYTPEKIQPVSSKTESLNLSSAIEAIKNSKRPLIYAGGGVISGNASEELKTFAELIDAPVACSIMGLGGIPASHRLFAGNLGMHGSYETGMATLNADLIFAAGARFSDRVAGDREKFAENATVIHIDIDPKEINKNVKTDIGLIGNIKDVLAELIKETPRQNHSQWIDEIYKWRNDAPKPQRKNSFPDPIKVIEEIRSLTSDDDIIVTDVGQHQMWVAQTYKFEKPSKLLTSGGLGTMGYGMGAAIGAATGNPDKRVVLITGDGSFHMNLNEMVTLKSYNLPVIVVIMNNTVLGMVRQWQKLFYGRRFSHTDPHRATDFPRLANAFGLDSMIIDSPESISPVLKSAFALNKPVIIDCRISPDDNVLPMIPPGKTVNELLTELD